MNNNIRFGSWEASSLMINFMFVQIMLSFPREMVKFGGSASWIIPICITIISFIYFVIMLMLYKNMGSVDLIDISESIGGRVLKIIVGLFISIFLLLTISVFMGAFAETLKIISLDKSPLEYLEILFCIGMILASYYGIEAVVRINAFLLPIIVGCFILITLGVVPEFDIDRLYPILGQGLASIGSGIAIKLSVFSAFIILFLMVPFFKKEQLKKVGFSYITISGLLLIWSTLSFVLVFPYEMALEKKIPIFQMARHISFGNFVQRIESVFVLICSICAMMSLCVGFTFLTHILSKALDLKNSRPVILPMTIIILSLTIISQRKNVEIYGNNMFNIILSIALLIPLLIAIPGAIKKVGIKEK